MFGQLTNYYRNHPEGPYEGLYEVEFEDGEVDWLYPSDIQLDDETMNIGS